MTHFSPPAVAQYVYRHPSAFCAYGHADHVTLAGKYYNAQGVAHAEKRTTHKQPYTTKLHLALQTKQYGDQPHPDKADTLLYQAKVAAHQGDYAQAMESWQSGAGHQTNTISSGSPSP